MLTIEELAEFNLALHKYYINVLSERFREHSSKIVVSAEPIEFGFRLLLESDVIHGGMLFNGLSPDVPRASILSDIWGHVTDALDGADVLLKDVSYSGPPSGYTVSEISRVIFRDLVFRNQPGPKSLAIATVTALMTNVNSALLTIAEQDADSDMFHIRYDDNDYYIADDDIGLTFTLPAEVSLEHKIAYWINFAVSETKFHTSKDRYSGGFLLGDTSPLKQLLRDIYKKETETMEVLQQYVHPPFTMSSAGEVLH